MTTPDAKLHKALWLDKTRFEHRMKTDPDADKLRAALPEKIKDSLDRSERFEPVTPYLVYAITERLDMEKEAGRKWPFHAGWHEAHECVKAAKEFVNTYNYTQTVDAHGEQLATTFDNNMYTAPEIFKPGFEFLTKTRQDVDTLFAAMPEKIQKVKATLVDYDQFAPELGYAIKVYLDMQKWAGKPCICATDLEAQDCFLAAKELLEDYKIKDKTSKATIAARDEELAAAKAEASSALAALGRSSEQLKAKENQLKVTEDQLLKTKDDQLKMKDELLACKDELLAAARQDCVLGTITTSGWVLRKVRQNDKWVRRWLEVREHVLYAYQECPAESPQARVINMLDLRKTSEIKLVDGGVAGVFSIVPVSADDQHPGYLMEADTAAKAHEWVSDLNKVRDQGLAATKAEPAVCDQPKAIDDQLKLEDELLASTETELAACKEQLKAKDDLLKSKDEQLKLSMALVASKDELAKAKQASKGKPLACIN